MHKIEEKEEKLILLAVATNEDDDTEESLDELQELVYTAGGVTVGRLFQNRSKIHPRTYIGKGKIEEVKDLIFETDATGVVCDDELSPSQMRNISDALDVKVMDRTVLILDIFAGRATTKEGKIQVELAQLKHRLTHLVGMRNSLSKLGGGIGTRGPGEMKLETDRRLIRDRISMLGRELDQVKLSRETMRESRKKSLIPVIAIVGYTNAGKSTLLNKLTDANVLEEDKLFATLDSTTRNLVLPSGQQVLLTDTVGFIRKLPHNLIEAFRSTLEEAKYSDIILHVVDSSNANSYKQMHIVYETLKNLNVTEKPIITVFNKDDLRDKDITLKDIQAEHTLKISAKKGTGIEKLLETFENILRNEKVYIKKIFPFEQAGLIQEIRKYGELILEEYKTDGILVKAYLPKDLYKKIEKQLI
ncbi:MAG TPA: GTPase HflX [Clostridiales bacterium]|nr:GTPase HflX [Clostridiales bacterium]